MIRSTRAKTLTSVPIGDIRKAKTELKTKLPVLDFTEVRRHRIPQHEAVVLELHEEGSHEAAEYFAFLFELDEETRKVAGPGTLIWERPWLKDNTELIAELRKVLTIFCKKSIPATARTLALVDTALRVEKSTWEWRWVADALYRSAFWIAREIENSDLETVACLRYLYARFLFYQMKDAKTALEYARVAHRESRGKPSWNASAIVGVRQECLFRESCALLQSILLSLARGESDAKVAMDSCTVAVAVAMESGHEDLIAEARCELGRSLIAAGSVKEALEHFTTSLAILEKIPDPNGICAVLSELVRAYKEMGDDEKVSRHLEELKARAMEFNLPHKLAEFHYLTGDYHLARGDPKEATPHLEVAFSLYNQLGAKDDANRARCLVGTSKGQELMEAYKALIARSIVGDVDAMVRLCRWRDSGEPFDGTIAALAEGCNGPGVFTGKNKKNR